MKEGGGNEQFTALHSMKRSMLGEIYKQGGGGCGECVRKMKIDAEKGKSK